MKKQSFVAPLAFLLAACALIVDSDAPGLQLDTDRRSYRAGEEVELTLSNHGNASFTVHPTLCGAALQRWGSFTWRSIAQGGACTRAGFDLLPGRRLVTRKALPDTLSAGRYRYAYSVQEWEEDERFRRNVRTELFTGDLEIR